MRDDGNPDNITHAGDYPWAGGGGSHSIPAPRKIVQITMGKHYPLALTNHGEVFEHRIDGWKKLEDIPQD